MATPLSPTARNLAHGFVQDNASVEQEQDANWALTELDKGLRSMKLGVQCESVVRFPRLFEKYPFPILINSAFLRLADVFRGGNNFLRWCIMGVTQQSEKHLDKVLNIDEFMRRIFQVIHSNDPVARAITIRTLGSIASIIPERKNVHHTIVNGLDSHDAVEVDAAVYAAERFAAKSRTFAANICSKMANMIEEIATPVDLKLRLIPVLQHMHHDAITAAKARSVCMKLLSSFPAQKFVSLILSTMTKLVADSLVDIQHQVELLISRLREDPRKTIKLVSLQNLNILAKRSPHQWKYSYVETLCDFSLSTKFTTLQIYSLKVLTTLSSSVAFQLFLSKEEVNMEQILEVCNLCYISDNCMLSSQAVEFYCNIAICHKKTKGVMWDIDQDLVEGARLAVTTQMCLSAWNTDSKEQASLKLCLCCAVRLVKIFPETANYFVSEIVQLLETVNEKNTVMLCECLAAIGSDNNKIVIQIIPQLLSLYQMFTNTPGCQQLQSYIGTVLFQAAGGEPIPTHVKDLLANSIKNSANPWFAYKLGRQAMRYGQYPVAADIFNILSQEVASEHFHFWLLGLCEICTAESCLQTMEKRTCNDISRVDDTLIHYQKGLASLKAASTPSFPMLFQSEFVNLRVALLQVHSQLIRTCNTFRTCPPPAIATALAMTNGQDISRCGQIISQLEKCVKSYEKLSSKFAALYQRSFDADSTSLNSLQLLQQSCEVMKSAIMSVTNTSRTGLGHMLGISSTSSNSDLDMALQDINKQFSELVHNNGGQALTHQHINLLCYSVQTFINTPLRYPRFFFQSLQSTTLKLAVTPQHNIQMDPILIHHNTFQTIKIEGIILHGARRELFRKIDKVHMSVNSSLINKDQLESDIKLTDPVTNEMVQSVEPHNDYFTVSFLLAFPVTGLHRLNIEAAVIDETGNLWKIGPSVTLTIKSYDETILKKQSKPSSIRTSFGQMPTPP